MAQSTVPLAVADPPEPDEPDAQQAALQLVADKINAVLDDGDFVPQREAQRILHEMVRDHASEHLAFLDAHAYPLYYHAVRAALGHRRRYKASPARRVGEAARAGEDLSVFVAWRYRIDEKDTQRAAGDMTAKDWEFSAKESGDEEARARRFKAFKQTVAKKVRVAGKTKTSEVFSEEEFLTLFERLVH